MSLYTKRYSIQIKSRNIRFYLHFDNKLYVCISDIAKLIWSEANFRNAIGRKSGNVYFISLSEMKENFEKWCHRDNSAKEKLENFDFTEFKNLIIRNYREILLENRKQWEEIWEIYK